MYTLTVLGLITCASITASADKIPDRNGATSWCRTYDVTGGYTRYGDQVPVSDGIVCGPNAVPLANCSVIGGGFWEIGNTYNLTGANSSIPVASTALGSAIDWSVYKATGNTSLYYNHPAFGGIPNGTYDLGSYPYVREDGNISAFIAFRNEYYCTTGRLDECSPDLSVTNGTYVEACTPMYLDRSEDLDVDGFAQYAGVLNIQRTNASYAANLTSYASLQPPAGLAASGTSSISSGLNGLVALLAFLSAVMIIMA